MDKFDRLLWLFPAAFVAHVVVAARAVKMVG
jgi:hypothetical protein